MDKRYHIKACLLLILILNVTVLLTQRSNPHPPTIAQEFTTFVNSTFSLLACWLLHARLKIHQPVSLPTRYINWISMLSGALLLLTIDYVADLIIPKSFEAMDPSTKDFRTRLLGSLFISIVCYTIYSSLYTRDMLQKSRLEVERLKQEGLRTQVIGLQQQLSPHFLFNSLSTLKGLATERPVKEFILRLAHIYRYVLDGTQRETITLADELNFTRAYLYIQEKRFGDAIQVNLNVPDLYLSLIIPPISLQLLIENALKHNGYSHEQPLLIDIYVNEYNELVVKNNCTQSRVETEGTGVGLQNIRERFRLLFKKEIKVNALPDAFMVCLPLTANESNNY